MNDAPRRWWNILDKAVCRYDMVPTRANRCCDVLCSTQSCERTWKQKIQHAATMLHLRKMLDPITGCPDAVQYVAGIIDLSVDDAFGTGGTEMEHRVLARLRKDFQVGSQDWNDVTFTRQRIRSMKDP